MTKSEIVLTSIIGIAAILVTILIGLNIYLFSKIDGFNGKINELNQSFTTINNQIKIIADSLDPEKKIPRLLSLHNLTPSSPNSYQYSSNTKLGDKELKSLKELGATLIESNMKPVSREPMSQRNMYYYDVQELRDLQKEKQNKVLTKESKESE